MTKQKDTLVKQIAYLDDFRCAADKCPDTCCSQWVINVSPANKEFYEQENTKLVKDLESHSDGDFRMKSNSNGDCIQLKDGLCTLQQAYGETNLPDICYTFPRGYKQISSGIYMSANLACPESLRVALYSKKKTDFSKWTEVKQSRSKTGLYDSRSGALSDLDEDKVMDIFGNVTKMIDTTSQACDESLARLVLLSYEMSGNDFNWPNIGSEVSMASKAKALDISKSNLEFVDMRRELFTTLEAMFDLVNRDRPRYNMVVKMVKEALGDQNSNEDELIANYEKIYNDWEKNAKEFDSILKNFIKAQISYAMFPIGDYFTNKYHSAAIIALEYLVVKLALMTKRYQLGRAMTQEEVVDIVQPISKRFYVRGKQDIYNFCEKAGWSDPEKLVTLILNF